MSQDKNRHTAHISEAEKAWARIQLLHALESLDAIDQWGGMVTLAQDSIRMAMRVLNMKEQQE